jgi:hypothetical protein
VSRAATLANNAAHHPSDSLDRIKPFLNVACRCGHRLGAHQGFLNKRGKQTPVRPCLESCHCRDYAAKDGAS